LHHFYYTTRRFREKNKGKRKGKGKKNKYNNILMFLLKIKFDVKKYNF
jgi:hypothetical protein